MREPNANPWRRVTVSDYTLPRVRFGRMQSRWVSRADQVADDRELTGVGGEQRDTVHVGGGSDREIDRAPCAVDRPGYHPKPALIAV